MRRTKIVCTLGPASGDPEVLDALVAAGMDCARLNFSHGDHEGHRAMAAKVREAAKRARRPLAILADLCGPKMRVGKFAEGKVELIEGATFTFTTEDVLGDEERVSVSYKPLPRDVKPGDAILLDDGLRRVRVTAVTETDVITEVEVGGTLSDRKGLNLPGTALSTPALTAKDREDLRFAVDELKVDYLALSFVRTAADVAEAQALSEGTPVIAKIESPRPSTTSAQSSIKRMAPWLPAVTSVWRWAPKRCRCFRSASSTKRTDAGRSSSRRPRCSIR